MPLVTTGGGTVTGANIADGTISNADIASDAAIDQSKLNLDGATVAFESTAAGTHSLTTAAGERVLVWAYCDVEQGHAGNEVVTLKYNGVTKDTAQSDDDNVSANIRFTYALMYSEIPGAATADITLTAGTGTIQNPRIFVLIFKP